METEWKRKNIMTLFSSNLIKTYMGIYNVRFNGHDANWCIQYTERLQKTSKLEQFIVMYNLLLVFFLASQVQFMDIHLTDRQTLFKKWTNMITSHIHMMHQDEDIIYKITCKNFSLSAGIKYLVIIFKLIKK
jgi:hypothetical protein